MKKQGDAVVVHGLRGRASNRKLPAKTQRQAVSDPEAAGLARFRADLRRRAAGQTASDPGRQRDLAWMDDRSGIVEEQGASDRRRCTFGGRGEAAFGELVQWDTSDHDWLEGRGPVRYLVRMIDDATSWSWGRFVESDATPQNMGVLWEYLEKNGRMVDVYTDRDSMFTVAPRPGESKDQQREADRLTQLGRAMRELGIGSILAYSPQAKGRIERSFRTAQDRLVKHLRLAKDLDAGRRQRVSGERVLAGVECAFRPARGGLPQPASGADAATGSGRDSLPRGRARDRQRLHVLLRRPPLPDRARRGASGNAPPAIARGTPPRRRIEGALSGPLLGDRRVRHAGDQAVQPKASKPVRKDHNAGGRSIGCRASSTVPARRCGS